MDAVKGLQILATYPQQMLPIGESTFEDILTIFTSIMTSGWENTFLWKLALKALMEIGTFIDRYHDSEKVSKYITIVVEKAVSLICRDGSDMPLQLQLEALFGIGTSGQVFMLQVTQGLEAAISANLLEAGVCGLLLIWFFISTHAHFLKFQLQRYILVIELRVFCDYHCVQL